MTEDKIGHEFEVTIKAISFKNHSAMVFEEEFQEERWVNFAPNVDIANLKKGKALITLGPDSLVSEFKQTVTENTPTGKPLPGLNAIEVEIISVAPATNSIKVNQGGEERWIKIVEPANIKWARKGMASIKLDAKGDACYVRGVGAQSAYAQKSKGFGYKQSNPVMGNQYQPKEEFHYDNQVKSLFGITLEEFEKTYNQLAKENWVISSQLYPKDIVEKDFILAMIDPAKDYKGKDVINVIKTAAPKRLFDVNIYLKVKKTGSRDTPEEIEF